MSEQNDQNKRLKTLRKTLKLSQEEFGKRINLSQTHISSLEKGQRELTHRVIEDICREFKVDYDWLSYGRGDSMFEDPEVLSVDERLADWFGWILNPNNDASDFITRVMLSLSKLESSDWKVIEKVVDEIEKAKQTI